jgi:hypothetical protein
MSLLLILTASFPWSGAAIAKALMLTVLNKKAYNVPFNVE